MRIEKIHISQFGHFVNKDFSGLGPGVNVLYGENEAGKTTLLEFIRRTLFGYPTGRSTKINLYPTENGKPQSGFVECCLKNGDKITISRINDKKSDVEVRFGDQIFTGDDIVKRYLGSMTRELFSSLYAIGLDELHNVITQKSQELQGILFGAGTGSVNPTDVRKMFQKNADVLFTQRGRKRPVNETVNDIKRIEAELSRVSDQVSQFDTLIRQGHDLKEKGIQLRNRLDELIKSLRSLETQERIFPLYIRLRQIQEELQTLEGVADLPASFIDSIDERRKCLGNRRQMTESYTSELSIKDAQAFAIALNQDVLSSRNQIEQLSRKIQSYTDAVRDFDSVKQDRDSFEKRIVFEASRIDDSWTLEKIAAFSYGMADQQNTRNFRERIQEAKRNLQRALEINPADVVIQKSEGLSPVALWAMLIISVLATIAGGVMQNWWLTGFSVPVLVLVVVVMLKSRVAGRQNMLEGAAESKEDIVGQCRQELLDLEKSWSAVTAELGFSQHLEPDVCADCVNNLIGLKKDIDQMRSFDERLEKMRKSIDATDTAYREVTEKLSDIPSDIDVVAGSVHLDRILKTELKRQAEFETIGKQAEELRLKMSREKNLISEESKLLVSELKQHGLSFVSEFDEVVDLLQQKIKLQEKLRDSEAAIQQVSGTEERFDSVMQILSTISPEDIASEKMRLESELSALKTEIDQCNQALGKIKSDIGILKSRDDISVMRLECQQLYARLEKQVSSYVAACVGRFVVGKAIAYHEENRQPAVLQYAGKLFESFTGGKYDRIVQSFDDKELKVCLNNSEDKKLVNQLSRGAREQLYLALRMAAIREYEQRGELLPVIADDIFVNFDDERKVATLTALTEYARERQLLVLTCHLDTRDRCVASGARNITLN